MKGLEALEKIRQFHKDWKLLFNKKELDIIEKELKALEIIKKKRVDIKDLINEFDWSDGLTSYNERTNHIPLTQEEYDLLKEVLL